MDADGNLETITSSTRAPCWCGATDGPEIGPDYRRCARCGTAVLSRALSGEHFQVFADDHDFYGKTYWLDYQRARGLPDILERARTDLSERCLFWLERLLERTRPPGRVLEIGCGHGAFVALLGELGFDAVGMDLSPWVVEFARRTFGVTVTQGTLERHDLEAGFGCVAAFDVLEHLADPVDAMRRCARLLAPGGVLLLQTPCYRGEGPDWPMFQKDEHVYLFTEASVRDLLGRAGFHDIEIGPSLFPYDMWIAASTSTLARPTPAAAAAPLPAVFRALLDLNAQTVGLRRSLAEAEADRTERFRQVEELTGIAHKQEADLVSQAEELTAQVERLTRLFRESEADRAARLEVIRGAETQIQTLLEQRDALRAQNEQLTAQNEQLTAQNEQLTARNEQLTALETDRAARVAALTAQVEELTASVRKAEADRITQVEELAAQIHEIVIARQAEAHRIALADELTAQIEELTRRLRESEVDRTARLEVIRGAEVQVLTLHAEIRALRGRLERIERSLAWRVYRTLVRRR